MPLGLERRHNLGHLHFITFSCRNRLPYLEISNPGLQVRRDRDHTLLRSSRHKDLSRVAKDPTENRKLQWQEAAPEAGADYSTAAAPVAN